MDICHNEQVISLETGVDIKEVRADGVVWDLDECYVTGWAQVHKAFYGLVFGAFTMGISFAVIFQKPKSI